MVDLLVYTNHRMGDMYYNNCKLFVHLNGAYEIEPSRVNVSVLWRFCLVTII
jgi:hypothetical protein